MGRNFSAHSLPTDEMLAYDAAIAALGLMDNGSEQRESDHPFFFETKRRQQYDLARMLCQRLYRVRGICESDKIAKITKWASLYT